MRRNNFRRRVWRPALVRAGLLGQVEEIDGCFRASWPTSAGIERTAIFRTHAEAVRHVAAVAFGGQRFHDLRHFYATWLVTQGVPINAVRRVMGHEQTSTTLDIYTHAPED